MPNSAPPFQPTTSVLNDKNEHVAWDLLEQSAKEIGLPATANKYGVKLKALHARKTSHKWKGVVDARTLTKTDKGSNGEIVAASGDLSAHIPGFRARTFQKVDESIKKFKAKAPKSFRELDNAVKIGERMLGIGEETSAHQTCIIKINEQIDAHDLNALPIEATLIPCDTEQLPNESSETVEQDNSEAAPQLPNESNAPAPPSPRESREESAPVAPLHPETIAPSKQGGSVTLNPGDSSKRQFVLP